MQFRGGPISLAEFMSEVLTNPQHGYYSQVGRGVGGRRQAASLPSCAGRVKTG